MSYPQYSITASYAPPSSTITFPSGAYAISGAYAYGGVYVNSGGVSNPGISNEHGAVRYSYWNDEQEDEILDKVEQEGLLILDQSEDQDKPAWYDVIDPKVMDDNLKKPIVPSKINEEIVEFKEEKVDKMVDGLIDNVSETKKPTWKDRLNKILRR